MSRHPTGAHDLTASRLRSMRTEGDMRHFLNLSDAGGDAVAAMLSDAIDRKAARRGWPKAKPDADRPLADHVLAMRSEEHTSELQSLMRSSYAVFCLKKKTRITHKTPKT